VTASTAGSTASDAGTIDALKRIKATEAEWAEKTASARRESETAIRRWHDESDAIVAATRAAAEAERAQALATARAAADAEAHAILAEGQAAAIAVATTSGKRPADRADEVLAVVLGSFARE